MLNKSILIVLIAVLSIGTASAKSGPKEKTGLASGIAVGALAGGPVGALVGMVFGVITGKNLDEKDQQKTKIVALENNLKTTKKLLLSQQSIAQKALAAKKAHQELAQKIGQDLSIDVLFRTNSVTLEPQGYSKIEPIASLMKTFPELVVQLQGYADSRGTDINNLALSNERANTVKEALIKIGIDASRIKIEGFGERFASANESDLEGTALDRHVAIKFSTQENEQSMASR